VWCTPHQVRVRRFPGPDAEPLWLDEGTSVDRMECEVSKPIRFGLSGGYMGDEMWSLGGVVVAIRRLADELPEDELAFVMKDSGLGLDLTADWRPEYEAAVERGRQAQAAARPTTAPERAELLGVTVPVAWRPDDELSLIMSTPQASLAGANGEPLTPWGWLAAGSDPLVADHGW